MKTPGKLTIAPNRVRYIKLGKSGSWEKECVKKSIIRIGFGSSKPERFKICQSGQWDRLKKSFIADGDDPGSATRFANELRLFWEDDGSTLWITFIGELLYWGLLKSGKPKIHTDGKGVWRVVAGSLLYFVFIMLIIVGVLLASGDI